MKRRALAAWLIAGSTCAACASIEGLTGGVAGGLAEGGTPEAAVPVDASSSTDGGADAGPDATLDAGSRFCRGVDASFCADFDEGPLGTDWSELLVAGGKFGLDSTLVRSKPNSLHMEIADAGADGFLRKALPTAATKLHVAADVNQMCNSLSNGQYTLLELRCTMSDGQRGGVAFSLATSGPHKLTTTRVSLGPTLNTDFDVALPPGVWRTLSVDATFGSPGKLSVSVDGIEVAGGTPNFGCQNTASLDLIVGLVGSNAPCMVNVDNVILDD